MKKTTLFIFLFVFASSLFAQYNTTNLTIPENTDAYTYENLRLFPIKANKDFLEAFKNVGKFISLSKALDENKVVITEAVDTSRMTQGQYYSSGESVNKLFIENISDDTVLVLAGEVVKGGKQDRMIAQNFLLPPKSGKMDLSVFCVEHGRWTYQNQTMLGVTSKFASNHHYSSSKMRKIAIVNKSQQQVWSEVDSVTRLNDAVTSSGTYTALMESEEYKKKLDAYVAFFNNALKNDSNIIGFVACSGDKVIGCDMFATKDMFNTQLDNLLQSYSAEAITNGSKPKVDKAKAQEFLNKFLADESTQETEVNKSGTILKSGNRKLMISKF